MVTDPKVDSALARAIRAKAQLYIELASEMRALESKREAVRDQLSRITGLVGEDRDSELPIVLPGVGKVHRVFCKGREMITRASLAGALGAEGIVGSRAERIIAAASLPGAEYSYLDVVPEGGRGRQGEGRGTK